jgi:hypothetical protein
VLVLVTAVTLTKVLTSGSAAVPVDNSVAHPSTAAQRALYRREAASWVASQVSHDALVSCDPVMCAALRDAGFPVSKLRPLSRSVHYPLTASVVVATPAVDRQLGSKLATTYAPAVLATFGRGTGAIAVRVIAPRGAAAYESEFRADVKVSKTVGTGLVTSRQITVSNSAKSAMEAGQVDPRLLIIITALAAAHPIEIVSFGGGHAGMTPGSPLRVVDLAEPSAEARLSWSAYVRSTENLLAAQPVTYRPAYFWPIKLADGQRALRIEFAAPTPLGLLNPSQ